MLIFVLGLFGLGGRLITGNLQVPVWRAILDTRISDARLAVAAGVVVLGLVVGIAVGVWFTRFRDRGRYLLGASPGRRALPRCQNLVRLLTRALPAAAALVAFPFIKGVAGRGCAAAWPARRRGVFFGIAALAYCITQVPRGS